MGVMSCHRKHCSEIMCDTYIDGIGYICHDCKVEFKTHYLLGFVKLTTKNQFFQALVGFMETTKQQPDTEMTVVSQK